MLFAAKAAAENAHGAGRMSEAGGPAWRRGARVRLSETKHA